MNPRDLPPTCRWCGGGEGTVVLDLGDQPSADLFPAVDDPGPDPTHPLRMWLCAACGLAQLAEDPFTPEEPRGVEPAALVEQARDAVGRIRAAGLVPATGTSGDGATVVEFGSPHGGSWLDLLAAAGLRPAAPGARGDVVVDCFGLMHAADQAAGLEERVAALAPGGTLLLQFHSLAAIVDTGGWNALRHGHFAYYSTPVLVDMLAAAGLVATHAFCFDLYGGTVLLAARRRDEPLRGDGTTPRTDLPSVGALVARERQLGVADPHVVASLGDAARTSAAALRDHLAAASREGRRVLGYAAASRAVPLLNRAGIGPDLLPAVVDGSPVKTGRRVPGTGQPIVGIDEVATRRPDEVVLFVTDLLDEVRGRLPEVEATGGCWTVVDPTVRVVTALR